VDIDEDPETHRIVWREDKIELVEGYASFSFKPMGEAALERDKAKIVAYWLKNRAPKQTTNTFSQRRWIMEQIAKQAVAETIKNGGGACELERHLEDAAEILYSLWYHISPDHANNAKTWLRKDTDLEPDDKMKERIEEAKNLLWKRHDPLRALNEGYESEHYLEYRTARDSVHAAVAAYLKRSWLRHPFLDWVFMDVMTTGELCLYGESLKNRLYPPAGEVYDPSDDPYLKTSGNLQKMLKIVLNRAITKFWIRFAWAILLPIGVIWVAWHYASGTIGVILLAGAAQCLVVEIWRIGKKIINRARGKPDPNLVSFQLWHLMHKAWRCLEGPVINPSILRDTMRQSAEKGAVWDGPAFALLDRIIMYDPAVWIVKEGNS
jgi:hypothetical protein